MVTRVQMVYKRCAEVIPQGTFSCGVAAIHLVAPYRKPLYYISRNEKMENG